MGFNLDTQATRSNLMSVDTTLAANIDATQDYIPVASTTNFSTSVVAEIETTNEVVSFDSITTNILLYSQTYSNSYWTKINSSITANATTAPDGTTTASKLNENTVNSQHRVLRSSLVTGVAASKTFTFSSHFKAAERSAVKMEIYADGQAVTSYALFGLSGDGTVGDTFAVDSTAITSVGNGWYRCSMTRTVNSSASGLRVYHITATGTSNGDDSYAGSTSNGIYLWGSQFEEGDITTYLPTTSASLSGLTDVTRGVNGTTAQSASSSDSIQQLPFAAQGLLSPVSTTLSTNITAAQDYVPLTSTNGFTDYLNATIDSNEVVSFTDISENRIPNSSNFTASNWTALTTNATFTANQAVAPDGTTTAASLVASGSGTPSYMGSVDVPSVASVMTFSCFVKGSGFLQIYTNTFWISTGFVNINAADGVIGSSATVANISSTSVGNDWYRVQFSFPSSSVVANGMIFIGSIDSNTAARAAVSSNTVTNYIWGWQMEAVSASGDITTYLPTDGTSALFGLTGVTRGANGTTAASATSGDTVTQTPLSTGALNMPLRLKGLSVSSDGTGAGRLTLCDKVGTHLCDVDIPDTKMFDLTFDGGILFPNGIYVANSDNITAYTLYTSPYNSPNLTAGG